MLAATSVSITAATWFRPVPLIVTCVPGAPEMGLTLAMLVLEEPTTVNLVAPTALPLAVATVIGPVVASPGTIAVIRLVESTLRCALAPLKLTTAVASNLVPRIATEVPAESDIGLNAVMVGAALSLKTLNLVGEKPEPSALTTRMKSVAAPSGTRVNNT
jgi:hypothetical protein